MMRVAPLLSAIALAGVGCTRANLASTATTEEGNVTPPPDPPAIALPAASAEPDGPFFRSSPDAGPSAILRDDAPNLRYAGMGRDACIAELRRRGIRFVAAPATRDVLAPIWLRGPLQGVSIHSGFTAKQRLTSSAEIFDCRLVLAVDDFASLLAEHGVVEVIHLSAYRSRKDRGCTPKYVGKQHCAALAVDVGTFRKKDGTVLSVEKDFHGKVGLATCTSGAHPTPATPAAVELWELVCESAKRALFHVILTPNYNVAHKNHLHLEITPDASWMLIK